MLPGFPSGICAHSSFRGICAPGFFPGGSVLPAFSRGICAHGPSRGICVPGFSRGICGRWCQELAFQEAEWSLTGDKSRESPGFWRSPTTPWGN